MSSQLRRRDVKKPKIQITNIVAKAQLMPPFTLSSLECKYPFDHDHKYNPKSVFHGARISIQHKSFKFSVFRTGTVMSLVSKSLVDLNNSFLWLSSHLSRFDLQLSHHHDITNVAAVSDFFCDFNLFQLANFLHFESSYDPTPLYCEKDDQDHLVDCIICYFHDQAPRRTALIFSSGKIVFTGFKSIDDLEAHALQLSSTLSQLSLNHPEVLI